MTTRTYTLLVDNGTSSELGEIELEAWDDEEAKTFATTFLKHAPTMIQIVVMRRSIQVAVVSRLN